MNFLKKSRSVVIYTGRRFKSSIVALCLFLMAFASNAAAAADTELTTMATDVATELSGLKSPLYTIGIAIIGLTLVIVAISYIKGMIRR